MSQLISTASNSSYTEFDTRIPSVIDTADIEEAFRLYHYGKENYLDGSAPSDTSIYGHLSSLRDDVTELQNAPTGGQVSDEVPHDLDAGAVKVSVPNGYIWVDGNETGSYNIEQGNVAFSNNPPATYSHGLIWVDKDEPITDPFNLDNFLTQSAVDLVYLRKTNASATYATIANAATKNVTINVPGSNTYQITSSDIYNLVNVTSGSDSSIVIPPDSAINFDIGSSFSVLRNTTAAVLIDPGAGVTINASPGRRLRAQHSVATALKIASNTWVVIGDTAVT